MDTKTRIHAGIIRRRLLARNNNPTFVRILSMLSDEELIRQENLNHAEKVENARVLEQ